MSTIFAVIIVPIIFVIHAIAALIKAWGIYILFILFILLFIFFIKIKRKTMNPASKKFMVVKIVFLFVAVFVILANYPKPVRDAWGAGWGKYLDYYKVDHSINISMPKLKKMTSGLTNSGTAQSIDKDYVSVDAKEIIRQSGYDPLLEYNVKIKSSLIENDIKVNIKSGGSEAISFVTLYDPKSLNRDAITISVPDGKLETLTSLLPSDIKNIVSKINVLYLFLENDPFFTSGDLIDPYMNFIDSSMVIPKGLAFIHNTPTYHYKLYVGKQATKTFLSKLTGMYVMNSNPDEMKKVDEAIGATKLDSLEVWIGTKDGRIHQYKASLVIPISKILGGGGKNIYDSEVKIDLQSTYYDFDIINNIEFPKDAIPLDDFINVTNDTKVKSIVSSFSN
jgi:hypothetical protein